MKATIEKELKGRSIVHTCRLEDGTVIGTRKSASREYNFAVIGKRPKAKAIAEYASSAAYFEKNGWPEKAKGYNDAIAELEASDSEFEIGVLSWHGKRENCDTKLYKYTFAGIATVAPDAAAIEKPVEEPVEDKPFTSIRRTWNAVEDDRKTKVVVYFPGRDKAGQSIGKVYSYPVSNFRPRKSWRIEGDSIVNGKKYRTQREAVAELVRRHEEEIAAGETAEVVQAIAERAAKVYADHIDRDAGFVAADFVEFVVFEDGHAPNDAVVAWAKRDAVVAAEKVERYQEARERFGFGRLAETDKLIAEVGTWSHSRLNEEIDELESDGREVYAESAPAFTEAPKPVASQEVDSTIRLEELKAANDAIDAALASLRAAADCVEVAVGDGAEKEAIAAAVQQAREAAKLIRYARAELQRKQRAAAADQERDRVRLANACAAASFGDWNPNA